MAKTDPELMSDRELLLELVSEKRRQDKVRVIKYIVWAVVLIALIVLAAVYVPKIVALYNYANQALQEVDSTMSEVDGTMQEINDTLIKLNTDYDSLKSNGLDILQDATDTVNGLIEKLRSFGIFGM